MKPISKRIISGLLSTVMTLSVICMSVAMLSINANAAVTPTFTYTPSMMANTSAKNACTVRTRGFGSSAYARFTVDGNQDPQAIFSAVPTVSNADKYMAIKYKTNSSMTIGCFYFLGAEPPVVIYYNNNNQWNTAVIDASEAEPNWTSRQFVRFDPFNATVIEEKDYIDVQYISFFSSKAKAHSYNGTVCTEGDLTVKYVESSDSLSITGYSGSGGSVAIESEYDGLSVTEIAANAFSSVPVGTVIAIPETVISISSSAFSGVENNITLSVKEGSYAHTYAKQNGLDYITEASSKDFIVEYTDSDVTLVGYAGKGGDVVIPKSIEGASITAIADSAFENNTSITALTIPDGIKTIGDEAFAGCTAAVSVDLPATSLVSIGKSAFRNCSALEQISIPGTVKDISDFAFLGCSSLNSVTLSEGTERIGLRAFSEASLMSVNLPASLKILGKYAFLKCSDLTTITVNNGSAYFSANNGALTDATKCRLIYVPEGNTAYTPTALLRTVERGAFYSTSRTSIELPTGVSSVSDKAFAGSDTLESVTLPRSVTSIGYDAFTASSAVLKCYSKSTAHLYAEENGVPYEILEEDTTPYDANGDGMINAKDIIEIKIYLADNTHFIYEPSADVNGDGVIDSDDIDLIADKIFSTAQ